MMKLGCSSLVMLLSPEINSPRELYLRPTFLGSGVIISRFISMLKGMPLSTPYFFHTPFITE